MFEIKSWLQYREDTAEGRGHCLHQMLHLPKNENKSLSTELYTVHLGYETDMH